MVQRPVPLALMRPLVVIVLDVLPHDVVHVLLPEDHEPVQALLLDALDEPLDVGVHVRRAKEVTGLEIVDMRSSIVNYSSTQRPPAPDRSGTSGQSKLGLPKNWLYSLAA